MAVELTGAVPERFEWRITSGGFELTGTGRLRTLTVEWPEPWRPMDRMYEAAGADFEHPVGAVARVRVRSGQRIRVEMSVEARGEVVVPGPVMRVESLTPPVSWLAGASGEVVFTSNEGPGLLTQRRGDSSPTAEAAHWHPLQKEIRLWPGRIASAAWTYETLPGDAWDLPVEPAWLPIERYVHVSRPVSFKVLDGRLDTDCSVQEADGEFDVFPGPGLHDVDVWSAAGRTSVQVGGYLLLDELRQRALRDLEPSPECVYTAVRHMLVSWVDDELLDWVDRRIAGWNENPSAWLAGAAAMASTLGLPLGGLADEIATEVMGRPTLDRVVILALHGLLPVNLNSGGWPIGDVETMGREAFERIGYGRIRNTGAQITGRDIALARLLVAGMGENERALRLASYVQGAANQLMCRLSVLPSFSDLAWLSLQE